MDIAALRTAYGHLGFSVDAQQALTELNQQNITSLEDWNSLSDDDIENICNAIRKPGGTILNPLAAQAGQPAEIPNPGVNVPVRAQRNMVLPAYYIRHCDRIS